MNARRQKLYSIIKRSAALLTAGALFAATAQPLMAHPGNGGGWGQGGGGGRGHGAPGPIAGAGLPFLVVVGGVAVYRALRRRRDGPQNDNGNRSQSENRTTS